MLIDPSGQSVHSAPLTSPVTLRVVQVGIGPQPWLYPEGPDKSSEGDDKTK